MRYDYEYGYQTLPSAVHDEVGVAILVALLGIFAVIALIGVVFWVLRAFSLYTIAKRRGIRNAWLSWLPIGADWILGSISDQYQHLAQGQVKSRRKLLLVLNLVSFSVAASSGVMSVLTMISGSSQARNTMLLLGMLPSLLTTAVGIAALVFYHMCNYDLYRSCDPKNAVAYLVIGIFIPVTEPFFYLVNRRKDMGMPQRTAEPGYPME